MKPKDLFIGAWVRPKNINAPFQVDSVGSELICDMGEHSWCLDEIEPIPITPEILEKNGWVVDFKNEFSTRFIWVLKPRPPKMRIDTTVEILLCDEEQIGVKCLVEIQCSSSNKGINLFHSCDCENIHQLQAALRLCGIEKEIVL